MTQMVRIRIDVPTMYQHLKQHRLPLHASDDGYRVHAYLQEVFDGKAPTPFRIVKGRGREIDVLAYTEADLKPVSSDVAVATKLLPTKWPKGHRFAFEVVCCPVVRMASSSERFKKGAEVDVFLRECWRQGPNAIIDRTEIYTAWLRDKLAAQGGAAIDACQVVRYQRTKLLRKTQGSIRKSHQSDKPAVEFTGVLEIQDSDKFLSLIQRGIGRHRGFGFGMLLVKRVTRG